MLPQSVRIFFFISGQQTFMYIPWLCTRMHHRSCIFQVIHTRVNQKH